ncbi:TatD family hydrolase [Lihuaxuella thermophila]|uniref:TatD DNase family protein n=1 Tax=Lihuaxuella thermophila TaxID=1173111 RepID=A0A1H8C7Y0_9BACL|nr:TatD family hydrolase [Lihuaxuella thermophila]SEM90999.1 TatD DNase family protein [Lihuaxuella thermophila]
MLLFDAHIHLEQYGEEEAAAFCRDSRVYGLIAVSMDLVSSRRTLALKRRFPQKVFAACGFHPEQKPVEIGPLVEWIRQNEAEIDAIGEIGLPYYLRQKARESGQPFDERNHLHILRTLLCLAKELKKPVILHAVYEDTARVCDLLEEYGIDQAHFHWIKTDSVTLERMARAGYMVSFTPEIVYRQKTANIAAAYPLSLIMAETDGPWPFAGPFSGMRTTPFLLHAVIERIAALHKMDSDQAAEQLLQNTIRFIQG